MENRLIGGGILLVIGIVFLIVSSIGGLEMFLGLFVFHLPLIIIGLIILFNENENKIEQINYREVKRRR